MAEQDAAPRGDYSISELRSMLTGETPAAEATAGDETTTEHSAESNAGDGEETRTEPESETGETDTGSEEGKSPDRGEDGKFKAKDGDNVQKRIDKAVKAQREAERRATEAEAQLAAQQSGSQPAQKPAQQQPAAEAAKRPDPSKFETYDAYIEALQDWKYDQRKASDAQQAQQQAQQRADQETAAAHSKRVEAARAKHADYDDVLAANGNIPISRELHQAIVSSEHGPEVAYSLAKNPEEAKRIAALPPLRQIAEFGKLEAKFDKPVITETKTEKKLPKPAANVGGSTGAAKTPRLDDPDISMSTFKRIAGAQLRSR
jgi:hypothetical protein